MEHTQTELETIHEIIDAMNTSIAETSTKPEKKRYYIKLGTKTTGRPKRQLEEGQEMSDLRNYYNKKWREHRGNMCLSIGYMKKHYEDIPPELNNLPQKTQEELEDKYRLMNEYVKMLKEQKYTTNYVLRKQKYAERKAIRT